MMKISKLAIAVLIVACSSQPMPTESNPEGTNPNPAPAPGTPAPPAASVATVTVTAQSSAIEVGQTVQLSATARDSAGNALAGRTMSWSSSNAAVVSVSGAGVATGVSEGSATITASVEGKNGAAPITVARTAPSRILQGWYVSPIGTSAGAGTAASPWDLQTALDGAGGKVLPGDTVWIRGGTYPAGGSLTRSGSSSAQITFSGFPGETAIIKQQFSGTASYVTIRNLTFEGPINAATNQVYLHNCHHVVFTRNEIRNGDFHAGLSVDESNNMTITYNYIHDNGVDPSHDHGIYFKTTTGAGTVIANNLLVHNAARGLSLHDNTGVGVFDVVVAHNTVVGNGSTGILVNDGDRNTLVNNIAVGNGDKTGQDQIRVVSGNANKIWNNLTWHASAPSRAGIENTTGSEMTGNRIANPLLEGDLRLHMGSTAINMGLTGWTFGVDFAGKIRDAAPDVGAYEFY